jgi:2-keto-4-pentenoate hydratase/2-oxohepta-3-ene-1,7-dioic acid hydratase in catechol pathway
MRLVTYQAEGIWHSGIMAGDWVIDSRAAANLAGLAINGGGELKNRQIIQWPHAQRSELELAARDLVGKPPSFGEAFRAADLHLGPPIPDPDKIICLGLNYRSHADEIGFSTPTVPILFAKFRNALTGPTSPVILPGLSQEIDYEGELAVVIRRRCKNLSSEEARECIAGYMALNDISARDLQFLTGQWLSGKTLDSFAPCGPALVMDEISDPQNINILTRLNGQILQQGNTRNMIFSVVDSIAYISKLMTLEPGDMIATGTPEGVGFKRNPPVFLHDGDLIEVEIEGIGALRNPVLAAS